jgi:hypothetical protein
LIYGRKIYGSKLRRENHLARAQPKEGSFSHIAVEINARTVA